MSESFFFVYNFFEKFDRLEVFRRLLPTYPVKDCIAKVEHFLSYRYYITCLESFCLYFFLRVQVIYFQKVPYVHTLSKNLTDFFLHCSANAKDVFVFLNSYCHVEFLFKLFVNSVSKWDFLKMTKL